VPSTSVKPQTCASLPLESDPPFQRACQSRRRAQRHRGRRSTGGLSLGYDVFVQLGEKPPVALAQQLHRCGQRDRADWADWALTNLLGNYS
jgi:hypothetical protein